jgi:hypothetical protein
MKFTIQIDDESDKFLHRTICVNNNKLTFEKKILNLN